MAKLRKQNIFNTSFAVLKFAMFWVAVLIVLPFLIIIPRGNFTVKLFRYLATVLMFIVGLRIRVNGKLPDVRPLMLVSNHISVFEFISLPVSFGGSFFGKKEIESFPLVGFCAKKFGVVFVDRRPAYAGVALKNVKKEMNSVNYPMCLFPEGTTTNGAYVKQFKSSLFEFIIGSDVNITPVILNYRYKDGSPIDDETMAQHFAYFDNAKQDMGPECDRERSAFGQVFHIMMLGGFMAEITVLEPFIAAGKNRKEIAAGLQEIVSKKYMELKDKEMTK